MLQLAQATATLVNNGIKHKPQLVIATQDATTRTRVPVPFAPPEDLGYKPENVEIVRKGMVGVTQVGTSARAFAGAGYISGGKTGTAQAVTMSQKEKYNAARMEEHQRDHALYVAFAPADDPKIALAVIVENSGFGGANAAPIARRVFDYWLLNQYPNDEDLKAVQMGLAAAPAGKPRKASDMPWPPTPLSAAAPATLSSAAVASVATPLATTTPAVGLPAIGTVVPAALPSSPEPAPPAPASNPQE
jgi:penicillin-binding protein 2